MRIAVIGLGKIGLPLAAQFAHKGHQVVGVDVNEETVETVNAGKVPFPGEAHLGEYIARLVPSGNLIATTDYSRAIPEADAIVVVVPLFVDEVDVPDFEWMDSATKDIAANLTHDTLVIYETTLPVGTTRGRWKPMLEHGSGLVEGRDFHAVFSPERVLTGRVFEDLRKYPKLVGGLTIAGATKAVEFYRQVLEFDERPDLIRANGVWDLGSAEAAEMAKLAETTYRDVNIALANQFSIFAESAGIDVHRVIEASNSQPYSHIHSPGISVGGHCIPVYPRLYLYTDPAASVVAEARRANAAMPIHAVDLLNKYLVHSAPAKVAVLGAAYRGGVKETAFSGVFPLEQALRKAGYSPVVHDPLFTYEEIADLGFAPHVMGDAVDGVILHTDHAEYTNLTEDDFPGVKVVVDGRKILNTDSFSRPILIRMGAIDKDPRTHQDTT